MDVLVLTESYASTSMAVAPQQGSCGVYMPSHASASANPAIDIESSSAYALATLLVHGISLSLGENAPASPSDTASVAHASDESSTTPVPDLNRFRHQLRVAFARDISPLKCLLGRPEIYAAPLFRPPDPAIMISLDVSVPYSVPRSSHARPSAAKFVAGQTVATPAEATRTTRRMPRV